ncbi:hypothetical protein HDU78_008201 [Chytriomyces hyalinus]|nr:hypothetical protein HDU78_008201 [Chytriomyces hyalinus]
MDDHLKTVASQIEAQQAEVRECKAAVMDAINNDKEPGFLETLYRDAVAILNQLLDERKVLAVVLANKGASAEDIIGTLLHGIRTQDLRIETQAKTGGEPSSNGAHEGDEGSGGPSSGSVDGGAQPSSGSSGSGSGRRLSDVAATTSGSDSLEHGTGSDAWQVSSSGVDERLDSGAEI